MNFKKNPLIWLVLLFTTLCLRNLFAQDFIPEFTVDQFGDSVLVERNALTGVAAHLWNSNHNLGMFDAQNPRTISGGDIDEPLVRQIAPRILASYQELLGVDPTEFVLTDVSGDEDFWYVSFAQVFQGAPVYNGRFEFTLNRDGRIVAMGADSHPGLNLSVQPALDADAALERARQAFDVARPDSSMLLSEPELLIFRDRKRDRIDIYLAYKIELDDKDGADSRRFFVDAQNGKIVFEESLWLDMGSWTVSGQITGKQWPKNSGSGSKTVKAKYLDKVTVYNLRAQTLASGSPDANGNYSISGSNTYQVAYVEATLRGKWAKIKNPKNQVNQAFSFVTSGNSTVDFDFKDTQEGFHVYYHMNAMHDFIKGSPFKYNGMNYRMEARVKDNSVANAAADGRRLKFSAHGRNWWESSDVVYHEYTHNTVYSVYGNRMIRTINGSYESYAMDEAIADYFAATLNRDSAMDWIGRNVSNSFKYPGSSTALLKKWGQLKFHKAGQVLSGAMWDLEKTTSTRTGRKLNFKAMKIRPQPTTFQQFANNVLVADDNNGTLCDGTPNASKIIEAFQNRHGISPTVSVGQPLSVRINGPGALGYKQSGTWTANVSGGCGGNAYQWRYRYNGTGSWSSVVGTSKSYSRTMLNTGFELQVKVTNSGQSVYDTRYITYGLFKPNLSAQDNANQIPVHFALRQNYPNPFNPTTEIRFALPQAGQTQLNIFNLAGQKVRTLVHAYRGPGFYSVVWDGRSDAGGSVASGIYIYKISITSAKNGDVTFQHVRKMTLLQ